jgi:hypothetical protein
MVVGVGPGHTTIGVAAAERPAVATPVDVVVRARTHTLALSVGGAGRGALAVAPMNLTCGAGTCDVAVTEGTVVTVSAAPAAGSVFAGYDGACTGTAPCTFTVDGPRAVTGVFDVAAYALSVRTTGAGRGTVTSSPAGLACADACAATFPAGTVVTLTAAPAAGSVFAGWSGGCGGASAASLTCVVTLAAAETGTAAFAPIPTFALGVATAGAGRGRVTSSPAGIDCPGACAREYPAGTAVTLTAAADAGSAFGGWFGGCAGLAPTCTVTLTQAMAATATFSPAVSSVALSVGVSGAGSGTVTSAPGGIACTATAGAASGVCTGAYAVGATVTLTAAAAAGSTFAGWGGACTSGAVTCAVTLGGVRSVTATFAPSAPSGAVLSVAVTGAGTGAVTSIPAGISCPGVCTASFPAGTAVTLIPGQSGGTAFDGWSGACAGSVGRCTITPRAGAVTTVGAAFSLAPFALSVTRTGLGAGVVTSSPAGIDCGQLCAATFARGSTVVLTATAAAGSTFVRWVSGCAGAAPTCTLTMNAAQDVAAWFDAPITGDFSLALPAPAVSVQAGTTSAALLNIVRTGGFTLDVTLQVLGTPGGVLVLPRSLATGASVAVLELQAPVTARPGTYDVEIMGYAPGSIFRATTLTLTVTPAPPPTFALEAGGPVVEVPRGGSTTANLFVWRGSGVTGAVSFTFAGMPPGLTVAAPPAPATAGQSLMTFTASAATPAGTYLLTVTGTDGAGVRQTARFAVWIP